MLQALVRPLLPKQPTAPRKAAPARAKTPARATMGSDTLALTPDDPALARLSDAQKTAFKLLGAADGAKFKQVFEASNRTGQIALGKLLERGLLTSSKDWRGGRSLLHHLDALATQPLPAGLDRKNLLSSFLVQLENPGEISQAARGTCTVTTVEYELALRSPAEYARIVSGLASTSGAVTLVSGTAIRRDAGTASPDDSGRTDASRLIEAALMELGNGILDYSNETDRNGIAGYGPGGLSNGQTGRVWNAVLGERRDAENAVPIIGQVPFTSIGGAGLMKDVEKALKKGVRVPIAMDWRANGEWRPSGHEVLVTKIENGRVYFRNPWGPYAAPGTELKGTDGPARRIEDNGGLESIPVEEMTRRIKGALLP